MTPNNRPKLRNLANEILLAGAVIALVILGVAEVTIK